MYNIKVVKRGLSIPEALRATKHPCTRQYLHKVRRDRPKMVSVTAIEDDDADVSTLQTESSVEGSEKKKGKQRRKSLKYKNTKRVSLKERKNEELRIKNLALKMTFDLLDYSGAIKKKLAHNKKYVEQELARDQTL